MTIKSLRKKVLQERSRHLGCRGFISPERFLKSENVFVVQETLDTIDWQDGMIRYDAFTLRDYSSIFLVETDIIFENPTNVES